MIELILHCPFHITKVQTDNGSKFTSEYLRNHRRGYKTSFEKLLACYQIVYQKNDPGSPWQNGNVECLHRLDRERFYTHRRVLNIQEANRMMDQYNDLTNACYCPSRGCSPDELVRKFLMG